MWAANRKTGLQYIDTTFAIKNIVKAKGEKREDKYTRHQKCLSIFICSAAEQIVSSLCRIYVNDIQYCGRYNVTITRWSKSDTSIEFCAPENLCQVLRLLNDSVANIVNDQIRRSPDSGKWTSALDSAPPKTFVKFYGILVNLFIHVDLFIYGEHNHWE